MAKVTKNALKAIVKECLLEILVEGLASQDEAPLVESRSRKSRKAPRAQKPSTRRPAIDAIKFDSTVDRSVNGLTDDPVLSSILADTARTTLQEQLNDPSGRSTHSAQVSAHGDSAQKVMSSQDPMNIFGDASMNWEALAFSGTDAKK